MAFLSEKEINKIGFKSIGKNVLISDKVSFYSPELMEIGSDVRIDDFCVLSGNIKIGNYVHISTYTALYGKFGIEIGNYCGISSRGLVYSAVDDFSGNYMISPMVNPEFTNVTGGLVKLEDYVQLGANTTVMPNLTIKIGSVTGVNTFVTKSLDEWGIYIGTPAKKLKDRAKEMLNFLKEN